ncbi:MAG: VCBS repeat-containing protein [Verrucomicrobiota bacterium]
MTTDTVGTWNASWLDYDGDGRLDVSVAPEGSRYVATPLYHNEGDGTFRRITTNAIGQTAVRAYSHVWGDYDNDGKPDLFVPNVEGMNDMLFRNNGNSLVHQDHHRSSGHRWGHVHLRSSGLIMTGMASSDLFVATAWGCPSPDDLLYRNNGGRNFPEDDFSRGGPDRRRIA